MYVGLPAHVRDAVQWLRGVCGGRGGDRVRKDLSPQLLRLHSLQVSIVRANEGDM